MSPFSFKEKEEREREREREGERKREREREREKEQESHEWQINDPKLIEMWNDPGNDNNPFFDKEITPQSIEIFGKDAFSKR